MVRVLYVGGPTALLEVGGVRFLTDPTFDPPGDYPIGTRKLSKLLPPAVLPAELGEVDAVLLSHDQHPDNLDRAGRDYVATAPLTISTPAAQERLGGGVRGLAPWEELEVAGTGGVLVTALPARHGPPGAEPLVGQVAGFALTGGDVPTVYVSGDNASLDLVEEIAARIGPVDVAVIFAGAARTALLDGAHLTLGSEDARRAAELLGARHVVPTHFEGWAHFSQGRGTVEAAFAGFGGGAVHILHPGESVEIDV